MIYSGIVQRGGEYGRRLGFPTANIPLEDASVSGIFAAAVRVGEETYNAAAYADQRNKVLEAHLLDFEGDLYGKELGIELLGKIREDRRFESEEEAKETIAADIAAVRKYFNPPLSPESEG